MKRYYLHDGSTQSGPFTFEQLKTKKLSKKTPVWYEGLTEWTPAEKVAELLDLISIPPPFVSASGLMPPPLPNVKTEPAKPETDKKKLILYLMVAAGAIGLFVMLFTMIFNRANKNIDSGIVVGYDSVDTAAENRRKLEELWKKNVTIRNNWRKYIKVTNSDYSSSIFGGISDLSVIVTNGTDYPVNKVVAVVTYYKASGSVWKTILVPVLNIPPNSKRSVAVQDVGRSTKVKVWAKSVLSKNMYFYYAAGYKSDTPGDPYLYK